MLVPRPVAVHVDIRHVLNTFVPSRAFGAGIDGRDEGGVEQTFRPNNLAKMRSAGLTGLTYRLRTELGCEAWHWNPEGSWSEPGRRQGYWISSSKAAKPIERSWGYRLPRRGNTFDQANDDGFSRIDDGSSFTFWKSNPYLDSSITGDRDDRNPQWVVLDLGRARAVDTLRIRWANPFAVQYRVEFWSGVNTGIADDHPSGRWKTFPGGQIRDGVGGDEVRHFGHLERVRYIRIYLLESSHTSQGAAGDPRDSKGFAIREIELGKWAHGHLADVVVHQPNKTQTAVYTSSTDPWHRESDRDPKTEQPGFDLVYGSGLTNGKPVLVPVPVLYDTPENGEAELRYLRERHFPIRGIELGEEPDGQFVYPEHYGALYSLFARRLRAIDPDVPIGGPSFQTTQLDSTAFPGVYRDLSWYRRFQDDLKRRGQAANFQFFSFEWYPFDFPDQPSEPQLRDAPGMLASSLARYVRDGLSHRIPWIISEYGYSAFAGPSDVKVQAGLLNLDIVGKFLELGGNEAYLYGYEPNEVISETPGSWGNLAMWLIDAAGNAKEPLPTYWAARMMTQDWCREPEKPHRLVKTSSSDRAISAYSVVRPDGSVAILLLNKDSRKSRRIQISLSGKVGRQGAAVLYGPAQYAWKEAGAAGHPIRSLPPVRRHWTRTVELPAYSMGVVTER